MAVVITGKLDDDVTTGGATGQTDRSHCRLSACRDETHLLDRIHPLDDGVR